MLKSGLWAPTWVCGDIWAQAAGWDYIWACSLFTVRVCDIHGPGCHQRPHWCSGSGPNPWAMSGFMVQQQPEYGLMIMAQRVTGGHRNHALKSKGCTESALSLTGPRIADSVSLVGHYNRKTAAIHPHWIAEPSTGRDGPTMHHGPRRVWLCPLPEGVVPMTQTNQFGYHSDPHPGCWVGRPLSCTIFDLLGKWTAPPGR